ncbi:Isochorismatase family protein YecD [compost metagenome]
MRRALVIIDMQEIFFTEAQNFLYQKEQLLQNINSLIELARLNKMPIIFIQHTDQQDSDEMAKGNYAWELHKGLDREQDDIVIEKMTWDAFYKTELEETLNELGIEQLVFAGAQTEFCLDTTMRNAYSKGFQQNLLVKGTHSTLDSALFSAEDIIKHHESVWNNRFVQICTLKEI